LWTKESTMVSSASDRDNIVADVEEIIDASVRDLVDDGVIDDVDVDGTINDCTGELCLSVTRINQSCDHPKKPFWQDLWNTEAVDGCV
jgi:hypothetical protein